MTDQIEPPSAPGPDCLVRSLSANLEIALPARKMSPTVRVVSRG